MGKKGQETVRKPEYAGVSVVAILLGTGVGLVSLLLLALLSAGLIWGGVLSASMAGVLLTVSAGLCALLGGRVAVGKGSAPMPAGAAVGGGLCLILALVCLGTTGTAGFQGQFLGILLMLLAGGCLAWPHGKENAEKQEQEEAMKTVTRKEQLVRRKKEAADKNRDTVLLILSVGFLMGGILGCLLEGKLSGGNLLSPFFQQAAQGAIVPSLWRELWTVFRWPMAAVALSLLPMAGFTVPGLFFLRGFFLSYGIVALREGVGIVGVLCAVSCLAQPVCWQSRRCLSWELRDCFERQKTYQSTACFFAEWWSVC